MDSYINDKQTRNTGIKNNISQFHSFVNPAVKLPNKQKQTNKLNHLNTAVHSATKAKTPNQIDNSLGNISSSIHGGLDKINNLMSQRDKEAKDIIKKTDAIKQAKLNIRNKLVNNAKKKLANNRAKVTQMTKQNEKLTKLIASPRKYFESDKQTKQVEPLSKHTFKNCLHAVKGYVQTRFHSLKHQFNQARTEFAQREPQVASANAMSRPVASHSFSRSKIASSNTYHGNSKQNKPLKHKNINLNATTRMGRFASRHFGPTR